MQVDRIRGVVGRWWLVGVALAVPLAVLALLRTATRLDVSWYEPMAHLVIMGAVAGLALFVAGMAIQAAIDCDEPGVVWLAIGCANVGLLLLGHGLVTPGALGQPVNLWVVRLPYAAMAAIGGCLFLAGRSPKRNPNSWIAHHPVAALVLGTVPTLVLVTVVTLNPLWLGGVAPFPHETTVFRVVSLTAVIAFLAVIRTHWHRWQLGRDLVQFAIVLSSVSCIAAVASFEMGRFSHMSWWNYHGYLLAGFGGTVYAIVRRGRQRQTTSDVLTSAFADDPFAHIVEGYPEALRTLVKAVEVKDTYTHGHSERTAKVAVELGVRMGLPSDRLRVIARGAYLHDLGKIGISDEILNKPGALDPLERLVMETHPRLGYELASGAPSLREALPVILHHHERVDGGGYPDGLKGRDIPLEARVVAVADVWDALTSDRAYRPGWAPSRALAHIEAGRGTHFDPRVVDAFVALAADWGIALPTEPGVAEEAWNAAQTCHEVMPEGDLVQV
jgi:HD-GYP domain-containing protein (c-di-GMP phosphodiesterase class II)